MINSGLKPCPACKKKFDMSVGGQGPRTLKCPHCGQPVVVKTVYALQAPGHEEQDGFQTTILASGKIGANRPCPCGSWRSYGKCCGGKG